MNIKSSGRRILRHAALSFLASFNKKKTAASLQRNRVQNLYFHFLPEEDVDNFISLIQKLEKDHCFISFSEGVNRVQSGAIDKPFLTISFDDGFRSNRRAAEILAQKGISACFFVCPTMVGRDREFLKKEFSGIIGDETRMMTWEELDELVALGHEIGSHTMSHPVLADLSFVEASYQIVESKRVLEERFGSIKHFAWPRGRFHHFQPDLAQVVFNVGYGSCVSAERGAHLEKIDSELGCIRRENCEAGWPIDHVFYLMGRSVRKKSSDSGSWPTNWDM